MRNASCGGPLGWLAVVAMAVVALVGVAPAAELRIACTTFPMWQLAQNITLGADGVAVTLILPAATGCPHDYEPTVADLRRLGDAHVIVVSGLGLDGFAVDAATRVNPNAAIIDASAKVERLPNLAHEHADGDHDHKHDHGAWNPHWFVSPMEMGQAGLVLAEKLIEIDPDRALRYAANATRFVEEMKAVVAGVDVPALRLAVMHDDLAYFARDFGLEIALVLERSPGVEPSIGEIRKLVTTIRDGGVDVVVAEPQYPTALAELMAREAGRPWVVVDTVASGPDDAGPGHYGKVMAANAKALAAAAPAAATE